MAINPVQLFQPQQGTSLVQILQGGNAQLTHILDQAIQIGRDVSNKRTQQEQDMLAMRQQETNMAQRRAEDLQQNIEDAQKFAFTRNDVDRKFEAAQQQQGWAQTRTGAQDLFGNQMDEQRMDLSQRESARQDTELGMRQDLYAQEQQQRQAAADYAQSGGEAKPKGLLQRGLSSVAGLFGGNRDEQIQDMTELESRAAAAKQAGNPALAADLTGQARVLEDKLNRAGRRTTTGTAARPVDPSIAKKRDLEIKRMEEDQFRKGIESEIKGAPSIYGSLAKDIASTGLASKKEADLTESDKLALAQIREKDATRTDDILDSVRNMTEDEFVKMRKVTPAQQAQLRRLYRKVKAYDTDGGGPQDLGAPSAVDQIPGLF